MEQTTVATTEDTPSTTELPTTTEMPTTTTRPDLTGRPRITTNANNVVLIPGTQGEVRVRYNDVESPVALREDIDRVGARLRFYPM